MAGGTGERTHRAGEGEGSGEGREAGHGEDRWRSRRTRVSEESKREEREASRCCTAERKRSRRTDEAVRAIDELRRARSRLSPASWLTLESACGIVLLSKGCADAA